MEVTVAANTASRARRFPYLPGAPRIALIGAVIAVALLLGACAGVPTSGPVCLSGHSHCTPTTRTKAAIETEDWDDASDPRRMLSRVQSDLDRESAGQPVWSDPNDATADPLLKIVEAYADFLRDDFRSMDTQLSIIERSADNVRERNTVYGTSTTYTQRNLIALDKNYRAATQNPSPLVRLYAAIRVVDGELFGSVGNPFNGTGPGNIHTASTSPLDGTWLKLPCRTIIGRVSKFVAASSTLKLLGGPVLDCPDTDPTDYAVDESLALHPGLLRSHVNSQPADTSKLVVRFAKPQPSSRDLAIDEMGTHPQESAPILEHYSHVDALGELDYALFLHALTPETPARDTMIRGLLADVIEKTKAFSDRIHDFTPTPYDGTDSSLLNTIRLASITRVANSTPAFYAIPCAILVAKPALIAATDAYFGSNMDNFMPRAGCQGVRGELPHGFPAKAVNAFESAATDADGNFIYLFDGSMVYGLEASQSAINTKLQIDPRYFLDPQSDLSGDPSQGFEYPYQVWGYTSLNNYVVSQRLRHFYIEARIRLANYYRSRMRLDSKDSKRAAKIALFAVTFGGNCGGGIPHKSIRRSLLERAAPSQINALLSNEAQDAPEIDACAKYAGEDPLLLVAVGDPAAFPLVLQQETDINVRNPIGKTALMEAAQFNQLGIVRLMLSHHALVNATTWGDSDPPHGYDTLLGDDARTALMYAAANGSLPLIKTLLAAGADPYQTDTKGYRAIDYLLGYGPTPPNSHLSKRERARAARWLF